MEVSFRDLTEVYKGDKAEDILTKILRQDGYFVLILADYQERGTNGAPGARSENGFLIMPDLDIAKGGFRGFVEVKYKSRPTFTRKTKRYEHGVPLKNWEAYQNVQRQYGTSVFLAIYEANSGAVLFADIEQLCPLAREYHGSKMSKGGMIFFPRASFGLWGKVVEVNGDLYTQLDLFNPPEGDGDKLFKVIRH